MKYILLIFFAVLLSVSAVYALDCTVRSGPCLSGETVIFKMSSTTNAHASLSSQNSYNYLVCCNGAGASCTTNPYQVVLLLSAVTNAHVQFSSYNTYSQKVCISGACGETVDLPYYAASCPAGYSCLASMSSVNNAHVGDCNAYTQKVCIKVTPHLNPDVVVWHEPTQDIYRGTTVTITATDSVYNGATLNQIKIYVDSALKKTCSSSSCYLTGTYIVGSHTYYATIDDSCGASARRIQEQKVLWLNTFNPV